MKVSDDDLGAVAEACRVDSRSAFEANERLRAELIALRRLADSAVKFVAAMEGVKCRCRGEACEGLLSSLSEAGR